MIQMTLTLAYYGHVIFILYTNFINCLNNVLHKKETQCRTKSYNPLLCLFSLPQFGTVFNLCLTWLLALLKTAGKLFCRMSLSLGSFDLFSCLNSGNPVLARTFQKCCYAPLLASYWMICNFDLPTTW